MKNVTAALASAWSAVDALTKAGAQLAGAVVALLFAGLFGVIAYACFAALFM